MLKHSLPRLRILVIFIIYGAAILLLTTCAGLPIFASFAVTLLLGILLSTLAGTALARSINEFENTVRNIFSGNFNARIDAKKNAEFAEIGKSLNQITEGFSILLKISQLLNMELDLDRLLNLIINETTKLLHCERASLFLYNEETKMLWSYIAQELEIKEIKLPLGKGIAGNVALSGVLLNIKDAYSDPRFDSSTDKATGFRTRNILCTPMFDHQNRLLGVIQVLNKNEGVFTEYDESLLKAIASQSAIAIENVQLYLAQESLFRSLIKALVATIDARDPVTSGHSDRVSKYSVSMGRHLGLPEPQMRVLEYASLLHDVGKIGVRDDILSKPGKFSPEEYEAVKRHPLITKEILEKVYFTGEQKKIPALASIHHEKLDGSGYPFGLKLEDIPLIARIITVADVYDALVSYDRPYKPALSIEEALKIIREDSARGKFDSKVVDVFLDNRLYELAKSKSAKISGEFSIEYRLLRPEELKNVIPVIAKAKDAAVSGLYFTSAESLPVNGFLEVRIHLPDFTIDALAKIIRREKTGGGFKTGIGFVNLNEETSSRLGKYLSGF